MWFDNAPTSTSRLKGKSTTIWIFYTLSWSRVSLCIMKVGDPFCMEKIISWSSHIEVKDDFCVLVKSLHISLKVSYSSDLIPLYFGPLEWWEKTTLCLLLCAWFVFLSFFNFFLSLIPSVRGNFFPMPMRALKAKAHHRGVTRVRNI